MREYVSVEEYDLLPRAISSADGVLYRAYITKDESTENKAATTEAIANIERIDDNFL